MSEKLGAGTRIKMLYGEAVVEKWLAEGGQGDVYQVTYNGEEKALKWYKTIGMGKDPEAFYGNLKNNVLKKSPSPEFLWPLDIAVWEKEGVFGYVMDLRPEGYYEISDYMLTKVRFKSYRAAVDAALHIVSAYRILHNKGYSYQDLNDGNFFINPENGDVRIGDNDNVAPNGVETGIIGKPRYMAPEIVTGEKKPDSLSDLFSMSVILFILFCLNHPLEGKLSLVPALTPALQEKLYGTDALFILDEGNESNAPDPVIHRNTLLVWNTLPDYMKKLFARAFSQQALKNPNARPAESDWIDGLVRFRSDIVICACRNNVFSRDGKPCQCEKCKKTVEIPCRLKLRNYSIPGVAGSRIYRCQVAPCNADRASNLIGQVGLSKADMTLRIKNVSERSWDAVTPSGKLKKVKPGESIPLKHGISFTINTEASAETIEIIEN